MTMTPAEKRVVALACEGLRNQEISERMGINVDSVKNTLRSVFKKLGVHDRLNMAIRIQELEREMTSYQMTVDNLRCDKRRLEEQMNTLPVEAMTPIPAQVY